MNEPRSASWVTSFMCHTADGSATDCSRTSGAANALELPIWMVYDAAPAVVDLLEQLGVLAR